MTLHFDPSTHTYTYCGRLVPSVTRVLRDWWDGMVVGGTTRFIPDEYYLERGRRVHRAIECYLRGDGHEVAEEERPFFMVDVPEEYSGYLKAAAAVIRALDVLMLGGAIVETPVYDAKLNVAGTPDVVARVLGARTIIEWKTESLSPIGFWQVSAYALMTGAKKGVEVCLRGDGTFATRWHDVAKGGKEFVAILNSWRIAQKQKREDA